MVISLKVKTLDSQTYDFTVDDEISVRQFKDTIAEKTNISADLQRIIYCGRVLADEKQLKEYDVNGKVVHVVERAPPNLRSGNSSGTNRIRIRENDGPDPNVRASPLFRALDGMVIGAMTVPVNANGGIPQPIVNPSSSFCMNRITVARHMLDCANNIALFLENPERGLNNPPLDILTRGRFTMESTVVEVGISADARVDIPQNQTQNFVEALNSAFSAALRQNGHPNFTVVQLPALLRVNGQNQAGGASGQSESRPSSGEEASATASNANSNATSSNNTAASSTDTSENESNAQQGQQQNSSPGGSNGQTTCTRVLAEVIHQMRTVQTRLEPFFQQYYDILLNDPQFEENDTTGRENAQRIYDRVSEALHYMSHAQHAISDLMLDLTQSTPRHLCCRPILVEQSGYVSSNNYLASFFEPNGNNNETTMTNNNTANTGNLPSQFPMPTVQSHTAPLVTATTTASTAEANTAPSQPTATTQSQTTPASGQANPQIQVARLIQAVVNSAPIHADVHVQINAPNLIQYGMPAQTSQTPSQTSQANGTPASNGSSEPNTTENQQPRVTTATHPTTSTQTRSTARPQVHISNLPPSQMWNARVIPANMVSSFDRFLPCSSHHIRETEQNENHPHMPTTIYTRNRMGQMRQPRRQPGGENPTVATSRNATAANAPSATSNNAGNEFLNLSNEETNFPFHLFGINSPLRDLFNVPNPVILNRIRNELRAFILNTLFVGSPMTSENMDEAINRVIRMLNSVLVFLPQFDLPDYDARASVENFLRNTLPFIFSLIQEDDSDEFGTRFLRELLSFMRRIFVILVTCIGRANAELYLNQVAQMTINSNSPAEQETSRALHRTIIQQLDLTTQNTSDVQEFLVIRRPPPESNRNNTVTPMETDEVPTVQSEAPQAQRIDPLQQTASIATGTTTLPIPAPIPESNDPLPTVVPGSEPWHNNFPAHWLPIITRDIERQRKQGSQPPFSDAYISGMSAKRRKLVTNSKPPADVNALLSDGVRRALQNVGASSSNPSSVDEMTAAISSDPSAQLSYREALRSNIQERLKTDPDFTPDKFPNSSKYFNK
ncbi:large proline-rich protein BAG6 isoform X5 [Hermetia illucens]|uniref:large proline-rich protein BAG6 isoform X5 n=1 Tax=Hermetia illucens TaxID=343691 RepID=UPI0018CC0541|nr:large proline-rich protein BAG6 isoform X5 [Hermetia illucens]